MLYDVAVDYSRDLAKVFRQQFEARGGQVVADEQFTSDAASDFRPQLRRIHAAGAEVLFAPNLLDADSAQIVQSVELGMRIAFLGTDTWESGVMTHFAALQETYMLAQWNPEIPAPESKRFLAAFKARYGAEPLMTAAATYDAVMILAEAIHRAGTLDPEAVRAALAATEYRGPTGEVSYPNGGDPKRSAIVLRVTRNGPEVVEQVHP
jgi:branched-chain amino acid transport system substrate-binding protein